MGTPALLIAALLASALRDDCIDIDLAGGLEAVSAQARIVPSFRSGRPHGFKLFTIRPGSWYALAGLANGDVLLTANGHDLSSPDKALEVYARINEGSSIVLGLERRGRPLWIEVAVPRGACDERRRAVSALIRLRAAILDYTDRAGAPPRDLEEASHGFEPAYLPRALLRRDLPLEDPWGRRFGWVEPRAPGELGCLYSRGPDGLLGTEDDLRFACDLAALNPVLLAEAGRACASRRIEAYGAPIVLLRRESGSVLAWSYGPDGLPDTSDDAVAHVSSACP